MENDDKFWSAFGILFGSIFKTALPIFAAMAIFVYGPKIINFVWWFFGLENEQ